MIEKITCMNCHCKLGVKDTHLFDGNPYCDECYYFASGRYLSSACATACECGHPRDSHYSERIYDLDGRLINMKYYCNTYKLPGHLVGYGACKCSGFTGVKL
jgi:hypothetical protein